MAMLEKIEAMDADECLIKIAEVLDKYGAYPWPPPPWWESYKSTRGNLRQPDKHSNWYADHARWFETKQRDSPDGLVRFYLRFRDDEFLDDED
ncbi:hypothetical protein [Sorangium sp. So ce341]|uniref:hypothetical protein n=1 Tax=Sorangium sp. So ce341 TaxID=3133302 RepID=UPI003F5E0B17